MDQTPGSDRSPYLVGPDEGEPQPLASLILRVSSEQTGGSFEIFEARAPEDGAPVAAPPPHVHSEHQTAFYVLAGRVTFVLGEDETVAPEGAFVVVPPGIRHSFRPEPGARLLILTTPAGLEGFFRSLGARRLGDESGAVLEARPSGPEDA